MRVETTVTWNKFVRSHSIGYFCELSRILAAFLASDFRLAGIGLFTVKETSEKRIFSCSASHSNNLKHQMTIRPNLSDDLRLPECFKFYYAKTILLWHLCYFETGIHFKCQNDLKAKGYI